MLRKGEILFSILTPPSPDEAAAHGVCQAHTFAQRNVAQLADLAARVHAGQLKVSFDTILPLPEARQAQDLNQAGHTRGKIVLRVV